MQKPQTRHIGRLGREFIETEDGGEDASDGIGLFGDLWGSGGGSGIESLEGVCVCHCVGLFWLFSSFSSVLEVEIGSGSLKN